MTPLISVIIPNYNHEKFLAERIKSVLDQSYQNIEVFILDDLSTDNSKQVIDQFSTHPLIKNIIYNTENSGSPFIQWQKGIALATGEYIWIAESDDYCDLNFLEVAVENLKGGDIDLFYARSVCVINDYIDNDYDWYYKDLDKDRWKHSYQNRAENEIRNYLIYKNTIINASAVVFRNAHRVDEILTETGRYFKYTGDWFFWLNFLKRSNKLCFSTQTTNYFRSHENTTRAKRAYSRNLETLKIYRWCCDNELHKKDDINLYKYYQEHHFILIARKDILKNGLQILRSLRYTNRFFGTIARYYLGYLN